MKTPVFDLALSVVMLAIVATIIFNLFGISIDATWWALLLLALLCVCGIGIYWIRSLGGRMLDAASKSGESKGPGSN